MGKLSDFDSQRRVDGLQPGELTEKRGVVPYFFREGGVLKGVLADLISILSCQIKFCVYDYFGNNLAHSRVHRENLIGIYFEAFFLKNPLNQSPKFLELLWARKR